MADKTTSIIAPDLDQHLLILSQMADQIRDTLKKSNLPLPPETVDGLSQMAGGLSCLSRQVKQKEEERRNLTALADIGQVVNS